MGILCLSCFVMHYFVFILVLEKEKLVALLLLSYRCSVTLYYKCSVALPRGAVGWSAACDCGIS